MTSADDRYWVIRVRKPRRRTAIVAVAIIAALIVAGSLMINGTKRVTLPGLSFDMPFGWDVHTDIPPSTGMGQTMALIGTLPWGPCDAYDINCHYAQRLDRGEVEVEIDDDTMLDGDMCAYALNNPDAVPRTDGVQVTAIHYFRVDGRPAIETEYSLDNTGSPNYYLADGQRKWDIAPADTTSERFTIFAQWRGPGDDAFLAQLDRLVASIKLTSSGSAGTQSSDCGAPFPSLAPA